MGYHCDAAAVAFRRSGHWGEDAAAADTVSRGAANGRGSEESAGPTKEPEGSGGKERALKRVSGSVRGQTSRPRIRSRSQRESVALLAALCRDVCARRPVHGLIFCHDPCRRARAETPARAARPTCQHPSTLACPSQRSVAGAASREIQALRSQEGAATSAGIGVVSPRYRAYTLHFFIMSCETHGATAEHPFRRAVVA